MQYLSRQCCFSTPKGKNNPITIVITNCSFPSKDRDERVWAMDTRFGMLTEQPHNHGEGVYYHVLWRTQAFSREHSHMRAI